LTNGHHDECVWLVNITAKVWKSRQFAGASLQLEAGGCLQVSAPPQVFQLEGDGEDAVVLATRVCHNRGDGIVANATACERRPSQRDAPVNAAYV
jgi:hypothetical protein